MLKQSNLNTSQVIIKTKKILLYIFKYIYNIYFNLVNDDQIIIVNFLKKEEEGF